MRDTLGTGTVLGYCTNVHAGTTLAQVQANLERYAVAVKARVSPNEPMGVGLWFSAPAARAACADAQGLRLAHELVTRGLECFTLNGFPFSDFHQEVVKHRVYEPRWTSLHRARFTRNLATIAAGPAGAMGEVSISTLPIAWRSVKPRRWGDAAIALCELARELSATEQERGRLIHIDLEPEPGCVLTRNGDVTAFFSDELLPAAARLRIPPDIIRRHLRVCHDICHSGVMFEDQAAALAAYRAAGIAVGKVQISSAVRVPFDEYSETERREAFGQLRGFDEPRYLHQTMIRTDDGKLTFFEDLPLATRAVERGAIDLRGEWRVHFHVPVFLERAGLIQTTQGEIAACLRALKPGDGVHHFEVETYAWNVLPPELQAADLAEGIARELGWVKETARGLQNPHPSPLPPSGGKGEGM